jgi:hypothetical protein
MINLQDFPADFHLPDFFFSPGKIPGKRKPAFRARGYPYRAGSLDEFT